MRLVTGGISQETNTFSPHCTTLEDFLVIREPTFFKHYQGKKDFLGGFIFSVNPHGKQIIIYFRKSSYPSGFSR